MSPGIKLLADEQNATKLPSALIEGLELSPFGSSPVLEMLTFLVIFDILSWTKTFTLSFPRVNAWKLATMGLIVPDTKAICLPSALIEGL
ncbi:MAG: hypothetical protein KMY52_06240 [Methanobacterium sp.]|nr:hypothetical protein [Methanobacterium sp.]